MLSMGPYRLESELGRGGMGVVFRGFDPAIGRPVAIKVLQVSEFVAADERALVKLRLAREALAAGKLSHPNIVTIYQLAEHEGTQFLVLELVDGYSLDRLLSVGQPIGVTTILSILSQVADALDYAHGKGIVHRDVKPANILIRPDGKVKITDFGIAHIATQTVTRTGLALGTPAYMAPEQIETGKVTGKADQFSLAVITYEMLSGQKPFVADTGARLMFKIVSEEPQSLQLHNASLSPLTSETVCKALAKNPDQRFTTCTEFVHRLFDALQETNSLSLSTIGRPNPQPTGTIGTAAGAIAPTRQNASLSSVGWFSRKEALGFGAGLMAVVLLLVVIGLLLSLVRHRVGPPPNERTPSSGSVRPDALGAAKGATTRAGEPESGAETNAAADIAGIMRRARSLFEAKDYNSALPLYQRAAQAGSGEAMVYLGRMYRGGWGVPQDFGEAMRWFRKAADAGNTDGMNRIGWLYLDGAGVPKDYAPAMKWFRMAADAGNADGMYYIASLYQNGWGVAIDAEETMTWSRKAADAGNSDAMIRVGWLYQRGRGVAKDSAEATKWFRMAADAGNSVGMRSLGLAYESGDGVKRDRDVAVSWYRKAVAAGYREAKEDLKRLGAAP